MINGLTTSTSTGYGYSNTMMNHDNKNTVGDDSSSTSPTFVHVANSNDQSSHNIGITSGGLAYTWGKTNALGQLGRPGKKNIPQIALFTNPNHINSNSENKQTHIGESFIQVNAVKGYVGGFKDSGHSAILDSEGNLWLTGCDRWQQLGLGSSSSGATGYTWKNGALWQETFQRNDHLRNLMIMNQHRINYDDNNNSNRSISLIRDVAIGGDHTVVLSSNKKDVYTFGKGNEGQLGLSSEKPFVSTPVHAKGISSTSSEIAAVCAIQHCTFTLNDDGNVLKTTGKCREMNSDFMKKIIQHCRDRASGDGLISGSTNKE